jgi:hypothetical protein
VRACQVGIGFDEPARQVTGEVQIVQGESQLGELEEDSRGCIALDRTLEKLERDDVVAPEERLLGKRIEVIGLSLPAEVTDVEIGACLRTRGAHRYDHARQ